MKVKKPLGGEHLGPQNFPPPSEMVESRAMLSLAESQGTDAPLGRAGSPRLSGPRQAELPPVMRK